MLLFRRKKGKQVDAANTSRQKRHHHQQQQQWICPAIRMKPQNHKHEVAVVACGSFWQPQQRMQKVRALVLSYVLAGGGFVFTFGWSKKILRAILLTQFRTFRSLCR
jgi:hypothetical protein